MAMRMSVSIVAVAFVSVRMGVTAMAVLMSVVMTAAALGNLNVKMGILATHCHIKRSMSCSLGCKFKVEHTVAVSGCRVALAASPQQSCGLCGFNRLEIGQCRRIESDAGLFAGLQPFVLQKELGIVGVCRKTMYMRVLIMSLGLTVAVTAAATQSNSRNCSQ